MNYCICLNVYDIYMSIICKQDPKLTMIPKRNLNYSN